MKHVARGGLIALLAAGVLMLLGPRDEARADDCKPDGQRCRTDQSCCGGRCVKNAGAKFGNCCTPTTCVAQGKDCGTISDAAARRRYLLRVPGCQFLRRSAEAVRRAPASSWRFVITGVPEAVLTAPRRALTA